MYDPTDGSLRWRVDIRQRIAPGIVPIGTGFLLGGDQGTLLRLDQAGHIIRRTFVSRRIAALHAAGPDEDSDVLSVVTRGTLIAIGIRVNSEAGE